MTAVTRLLTFVDLRDDDSVSARQDAVLADGRHVILLDHRGWTGTGPLETVEELERTARDVVGPDEPFGDKTYAEMEDSHWESLAGMLRKVGVEIAACELRELPHDVQLSTRLRAAGTGMFERAAPGFPVRDVDAALAFYAKLGFDVRRYEGGDAYGFATRDGVEIHLGQVAEADHHRATAYVFVLDADAVATEWRAAGAEVHGPEDTPWGKHEGAMVDPDGNVIRFGSPIR